MKKLLLILLLIPFNVFATNNYTEYKYSEEEIKGTDKIEVIKLKKCKYYKNKNIYTENYYNINYTDKDYIYRDNNFIYSKIIESPIKPNMNEITNLQQQEYTYYKEYNKINYFILNNFNYEKSMVIKEITIYDQSNNKINYEIIKGPKEINDKNHSSSAIVNKDDVIIIKLNKSVNLKDIYINLIVAGRVFTNFTVDYNLNYSGETDDIYNYGTLKGTLSSQDFYRLKYQDYKTNESLNDEIKKIKGRKENVDNSKIIKYETIYSYKEKLYKFYKIEKEYLDDYYFEKEGFIKDVNKCKTIYKYREIIEEDNKEEEIKPNIEEDKKEEEKPNIEEDNKEEEKPNIEEDNKEEINPNIKENNKEEVKHNLNNKPKNITINSDKIESNKKSTFTDIKLNESIKKEEIIKPIKKEFNNKDKNEIIKIQKRPKKFKIRYIIIPLIILCVVIYRKISKK